MATDDATTNDDGHVGVRTAVGPTDAIPPPTFSVPTRDHVIQVSQTTREDELIEQFTDDRDAVRMCDFENNGHGFEAGDLQDCWGGTIDMTMCLCRPSVDVVGSLDTDDFDDNSEELTEKTITNDDGDDVDVVEFRYAGLYDTVQRQYVEYVTELFDIPMDEILDHVYQYGRPFNSVPEPVRVVDPDTGMFVYITPYLE